jgi:cell division protein FtsB
VSPVAAPARKAPARRTPAKPARPRLTVVAPVPSRAPRAPFVLFSMLLVGLGLVALLFLNTVVAQDAFTLHDLDRSTAALAEQEQRLRQEIAAMEAPNDLAGRARDLGLVPAGDPVFVTPDGKVLGNPVPASAPPPPPPPPAPKVSASAAPPSAAPATTKPAAKPAPKPSAVPAR